MEIVKVILNGLAILGIAVVIVIIVRGIVWLIDPSERDGGIGGGGI